MQRPAALSRVGGGGGASADHHCQDLKQNYASITSAPPPHLLLLSVNLPLILGSLYVVSQGQPAPGPFNDEEDCMVPSTPTLYVPKRTDGFAEAIR